MNNRQLQGNAKTSISTSVPFILSLFCSSTSHKLMVKIYMCKLLSYPSYTFQKHRQRNTHSSTHWKFLPASTTFQSCDYQFLPIYGIRGLVIHPLHPFWKIFQNYLLELRYNSWVNDIFRDIGQRWNCTLGLNCSLSVRAHVRFTQTWTISDLRSVDCWPIL